MTIKKMVTMKGNLFHQQEELSHTALYRDLHYHAGTDAFCLVSVPDYK